MQAEEKGKNKIVKGMNQKVWKNQISNNYKDQIKCL